MCISVSQGCIGALFLDLLHSSSLFKAVRPHLTPVPCAAGCLIRREQGLARSLRFYLCGVY